jgi:hypothetical protein
MLSSMAGPSFMDIRTPIRLPEALRGEKYAFVGLPLAEFLPGGGVSRDNPVCPPIRLSKALSF